MPVSRKLGTYQIFYIECVFCIMKTTRQSSGSKKVTYEQKILQYVIIKMTCQSRKNNRLEDLNYEKRNHRHKQFSTHEMELQVSRSICTEIQKKSILLRKESRNKRNIKTVMPVEGSRNSRRRSMSRPYTHAVKHLTPNQRFGIYGVSKREKCIINQKWWNMKFAYRNREFWCKGYYVDSVWKNTNFSNKDIYSRATKKR